MRGTIYIWQCAKGHEAAVSEAQVRQSIVEPRCPIKMTKGGVCTAKLVKRLRKYPA